MSGYVRCAAAALALGLTSCADLQPRLVELGWEAGLVTGPGLLVCHGDFGQFANGYIVSRPMELDFVVDWTLPSVIPTNGGSPAHIIALNSLELSFDVQYEGYRAAYHLDRVNGTFSQRPNIGGVFFGRCYLRPLTTKV